MGKTIDLKAFIPRYIREAQQVMGDLPEDKALALLKFITGMLLQEIQQVKDGEIPVDEAPFYEVVSKIMRNENCYFCNDLIDGNETEFNYPEKTGLCLNCMMKVANILEAVDFDPRLLFGGIRASKNARHIQRRRYFIRSLDSLEETDGKDKS